MSLKAARYRRLKELAGEAVVLAHLEAAIEQAERREKWRRLNGPIQMVVVIGV